VDAGRATITEHPQQRIDEPAVVVRRPRLDRRLPAVHEQEDIRGGLTVVRPPAFDLGDEPAQQPVRPLDVGCRDHRAHVRQILECGQGPSGVDAVHVRVAAAS
jgi:hypothetical protein